VKTIIAAYVLIFGAACSPSNSLHSYQPPNGYVSDEKTAIAIADAILLPIYGSEQLSKEKPLVAELKNGVWFVSGSLPKPPEGSLSVGGTAEVEISQRDGRILRVSHGE
jgi:hypothetical protein